MLFSRTNKQTNKRVLCLFHLICLKPFVCNINSNQFKSRIINSKASDSIKSFILSWAVLLISTNQVYQSLSHSLSVKSIHIDWLVEVRHCASGNATKSKSSLPMAKERNFLNFHSSLFSLLVQSKWINGQNSYLMV